MPRFEEQKITPRQAVDSSQSANIALPVQADLASVSGQGSTMFAVARALNGAAQTTSKLGAQFREKRDTEDKKEGTARAAEKAVTGDAQTEWLEAASDTARESFEETDGITAVSRFQQDTLPELARLEPGADIDGFLRERVEKFTADNGITGKTRDVFMVGMARAQPELKQAYLRQSIREALQRDTDGVAAVLTHSLTEGSALTPEGYAKWREYAASKGMHDDEVDEIAVKSLRAALASGDVDLEKGLALLKTPSAEGRPILADVPVYKEALQLAAKRGEDVQDERATKERYERGVCREIGRASCRERV